MWCLLHITGDGRPAHFFISVTFCGEFGGGQIVIWCLGESYMCIWRVEQAVSAPPLPLIMILTLHYAVLTGNLLTWDAAEYYTYYCHYSLCGWHFFCLAALCNKEQNNWLHCKLKCPSRTSDITCFYHLILNILSVFLSQASCDTRWISSWWNQWSMTLTTSIWMITKWLHAIDCSWHGLPLRANDGRVRHSHTSLVQYQQILGHMGTVPHPPSASAHVPEG